MLRATASPGSTGVEKMTGCPIAVQDSVPASSPVLPTTMVVKRWDLPPAGRRTMRPETKKMVGDRGFEPRTSCMSSQFGHLSHFIRIHQELARQQLVRYHLIPVSSDLGPKSRPCVENMRRKISATFRSRSSDYREDRDGMSDAPVTSKPKTPGRTMPCSLPRQPLLIPGSYCCLPSRPSISRDQGKGLILHSRRLFRDEQ